MRRMVNDGKMGKKVRKSYNVHTYIHNYMYIYVVSISDLPKLFAYVMYVVRQNMYRFAHKYTHIHKQPNVSNENEWKNETADNKHDFDLIRLSDNATLIFF